MSRFCATAQLPYLEMFGRSSWISDTPSNKLFLFAADF